MIQYVDFVVLSSIAILMISCGVLGGILYSKSSKKIVVKFIILALPYIVYGVWGLIIIKRV